MAKGEPPREATVEELVALLRSFYTDEGAFTFLISKQALLEGETPLGVLVDGRLTDVVLLLRQADEGNHT
jgi:hypothetical protein